MKSITIPISQIKSDGHYRGSESELSTLMDSMRSLEQLQEIVVNSRYELIAGRRRLAAAKKLGWKSLRAFVNPSFDDAIKALRAERDENCPGCRVPLTRQEQLELARRLEELENPEAAKRKAASQAKKGEGKVGQRTNGEKGQTRDKIGEAVGMSGRTLEKAQAIIDAGQQEPDRYLDLAELVSQDGQPIDPVYQEFRQRQEIFEAADKDKLFEPVAKYIVNHHDTEGAYKDYEELRDRQGKDRTGRLLPKSLVKVFNDPWIRECVAVIDVALKELKEVNRTIGKHRDWKHLPIGVTSAVDEAVPYLELARDGLTEAIPHSVCTHCDGDGCKGCKMAGWVPK